MMGNATVIFSDGSKRMAHNVDDTKLRWELKREQTFEDIVDFYTNDIYIRSCDEIPSIELAQTWRDELKGHKARVTMHLTILNAKRRHGYRERKKTISQCITTIDFELLNLKKYIKKNQLDYSTELKWMRNKIEELEARIELIEADKDGG